MTEQYKQGKLNGQTKTYFSNGSVYEVKNWKNDLLEENVSSIIWTDQLK